MLGHILKHISTNECDSPWDLPFLCAVDYVFLSIWRFLSDSSDIRNIAAGIGFCNSNTGPFLARQQVGKYSFL